MRIFSSLLPAIIIMPLTGHAQDVPQVAVDIAPVHSLVAQVMQGVGTPDLVLPPGASPHGYAMRPSQARALDRADVVFWTSKALTPWMVAPLENLAKDARVTELMSLEVTKTHAYRDGVDFHEHENEEHDAHAHEGEDIDPHGWLDPVNAQIWLDVIAQELSNLDPAHEAQYQENADAAQQDLEKLIAQIDAQLTPDREVGFIVYHDAFQYFEKRFHLNVLSAISQSDAVRPGPARLMQVREIALGASVRCVFVEPQFNSGVVDIVAGTEDIKIAQIDPIGVGFEIGPEYYPSLLQDLAGRIADCL